MSLGSTGTLQHVRMAEARIGDAATRAKKIGAAGWQVVGAMGVLAVTMERILAKVVTPHKVEGLGDGRGNLEDLAVMVVVVADGTCISFAQTPLLVRPAYDRGCPS